jgi:peptidoglycan/xylan/chitin deacetylase (PgdA/CDA1 family)
MVTEVTSGPNLGALSNFAYGPRAGYWRVAEAFDRHGVPCTVNGCATALAAAPWTVEDALRRGYEIACHGDRWESHAHLSEDAERERIGAAVETFARICGKHPDGWQTRTSASVNTRRLLIEEGGFLYDSDTTEDDLPYLVETGRGRPHVVVPFTSDNNDMFLQRPEGSRLGRHFSEYVIDAFEWLHAEGARAPKMMTISLHSRIIGRPGRIGALEEILRHMTSVDGVWFARRRQIAQHWLDQFSAADMPASAVAG